MGGAKFDQYKPSLPVAVRPPKKKYDKSLGKIIRPWKQFSEIVDLLDALRESSSDATPQKLATVLIQDISYSPELVEKFSIALGNYSEIQDFGWKAGLFLSALINNGKGKRYTIQTSSYGDELCRLCYQNTKDVVVHGDAGESPFLGMLSGNVEINGTSYAPGVFMKGGVIKLNGDAMEDDVFYVSIGNLQGGAILVNGNIETEPKDIEHGKVYHNGRLIVDK